MKKYIRMAIAAAAALSLGACAKQEGQKDFKYTVDQFADIKVIRYTVPGWDDLTLNQKMYAYHLSEAAKWGWNIHWDQNCAGNIELRHALSAILDNYKGDRDCEEFQKFTVYAKRVYFANGIHHHYSDLILYLALLQFDLHLLLCLHQHVIQDEEPILYFPLLLFFVFLQFIYW
mgnify:CR=1 FL=1